MDWQLERDRMIEQQLIARGIKDPDVLAAMRRVKRHLFVPDRMRQYAYDDGPVSIGEGQTISQPFIVAFMTQAAHLTPSSKVLEIGTGCGYQTAILAEIAQEIYSVEIMASLADVARERLQGLGYTNIHVVHGDGYQGWPHAAPYDAILITAAPPQIPQSVFDQLKEGGWLVVPVGEGRQTLQVITKYHHQMKYTDRMAVSFVPMRH